MIPPPHAVRLPAAPLPPDTDPVYAGRYYAALANLSVALHPYTPAEAAWILDNRNTRNRPMRGTWRLIREKISAHLFQVNGETVIFDRAGVVMSAQHRLKAIAEGTHAVPILSVYGVDPEAFATLDQGARRNGTDVLSLVGAENAKTLAGALNWAQRYAGHPQMDKGGWHAVPNEQVADVASLYPGMAESVRYADARDRKKKGGLFSPSVLAFVHFALHECDPDAAGPFLEKAIDGMGLTRHSWEQILRSRLEKDFVGASRFEDRLHAIALVFKAFNNARANKPAVSSVRGGHEIPPIIVWRQGQGEAFPELRPPAADPFSDPVDPFGDAA